jgi:crotonobetainyl-CoA:carnitine CoA-transferase CaiB-like acyl-CoA transferase
MNGQRFGTRLDLPQVGAHTRDVLAGLGYTGAEIGRLIDQGVVRAGS